MEALSLSLEIFAPIGSSGGAGAGTAFRDGGCVLERGRAGNGPLAFAAGCSCPGGETVEPLLRSNRSVSKWRLLSLLTDRLFHNSGGEFWRAAMVTSGLGTGEGVRICFLSGDEV